jgi:hypothetical protein
LMGEAQPWFTNPAVFVVTQLLAALIHWYFWRKQNKASPGSGASVPSARANQTAQSEHDPPQSDGTVGADATAAKSRRPAAQAQAGQAATGMGADAVTDAATDSALVFERLLVAGLEALLNIEAGTIDPHSPLATYGIGSKVAASVAAELKGGVTRYSRKAPPKPTTPRVVGPPPPPPIPPCTQRLARQQYGVGAVAAAAVDFPVTFM